MRCFAICLLLCALIGSCAREQSTHEAGTVARRLLADSATDWRTISIPGARLHLARGGTSDRHAAAIAESVTVIRRDLLALLGMSAVNDTARRADLFFVNSRDEMRRVAGRPLAGFIQQGEPTGVFVVTAGYRYGSLLRHELAHLYTFEAWGAPRSGRWLVEGFAAWAAGSCQGHSPDELAAGAVARRTLVPLTDLSGNFDHVTEEVAMPQAGSIVGFLVRHEGLDAVGRRWREVPGTGHPLGENGPALEAAWLDELSHVRPATLDVSRVLDEGC
jgi:hypothetical protein